ncbi:LLM class flavin-dependent oxidoreductase [Rhodococcus sp. W8901]|uniref:LLM class flavin-dependent oxidoreductase n=1 Tax=Rhodococcus sp. W8901 TaxID=2742603 RepID=UPI0015843E4B|nr:LLM class flavin-dependent oxidoreductase [Rhodococcus sp. W8901]QKT12097.1 LLM class flavin-dependent oxidoreductase [Rhodococcus sp. W8901]
MSVKTFWYLTQADGDYPWTPGGLFPVDGQRQIELAKTIDDGGFDGALVATWPNDPFVSATWAASHTSRMKFLVAVYANMIPARLLAEKALTFDAFSGGRLMINSVNGRDNILTKYDMNVEHDRRYELGEQYWADFRRYYREGTESNFPNTPLRIDPLADREVPLWGTGDSPAGLENSGKVLDAYLAMLRETSFIEDKFDGARKAAAAAGREFTDFGALSGVIVRPSRAEPRRGDRALPIAVREGRHRPDQRHPGQGGAQAHGRRTGPAHFHRAGRPAAGLGRHHRRRQDPRTRRPVPRRRPVRGYHRVVTAGHLRDRVVRCVLRGRA